MDKNILMYKVRPGDTLTEVAAAIGMTAEALKDFHNRHCGTGHKLWLDNLTGIKQIIIPDPSGNAEPLQQQISSVIICSTRDLFNDKYFVTETFYHASGTDLEVEYMTDIRNYDPPDGNTGTFLAEVRCSEFMKNGAGPDDKMSDISLACMESIFPIAFIIPDQGKISGIFELEILKQRFENRRPDLEEFFIGEVYKAYLDRFRACLEYEDYLLKQFASTLLFQLIFPETAWLCQPDNRIGYLHFSQNSFPLKCRINTECYPRENGITEIVVKGFPLETFSIQELMLGTRFTGAEGKEASGNMKFRYLMDTTTHKMMEAEASVMITDAGVLYRKHNLKIRQDEGKS